MTVLDLYTAFLPYEKLTSDGVHPSAVGQDTLAHILARLYKGAPTVSLASRPGKSTGLGDGGLRTGLEGSGPYFRTGDGKRYNTVGRKLSDHGQLILPVR